jgi:hypothetical protein
MSKNLDLDFIQHSPFSSASVSWLGVSVFLLGMLTAFLTWQHYQTKLTAKNEIAQKIHLLSDSTQVTPIVSNTTADIPPETKTQIATTVATLTTPWNALLIAIEQSDVKDVALLSLEPSSKKQQVLLSGEAKNLQAIMDYINRLEAQQMLAQVYLQKHNVDEANVDKPVKFTVVAQWHTAEAN